MSSCTFAKVLSAAVDWLVTVDPHLHRGPSLGTLYAVPAVALHAAPILSAWILDHVERPLIIGPGSESAQCASAVTMVETVRHVRKAGLTAPLCTGVHAVLADGAVEALRLAGVADVVTTNTIEHPTDQIDPGALLAGGIRRQLANGEPA